jgi:tripartite-type tricarboxylate transporter receptor subunit TctC
MKPSAIASIFAACIAFAASGSLPSPALCQPAAYPARPVTLIVPFAPGGGIDIVARVLAAKLQDKMHQPVVVENRPGGGGIVGTAAVAHAAPDGYTLLVIEASSVMAKWLHKNVPFQVEKDFSPVAMVATNYLGCSPIHLCLSVMSPNWSPTAKRIPAGSRSVRPAWARPIIWRH